MARDYKEVAQSWLDGDFDPQTKCQVLELRNNDPVGFEDAFYSGHKTEDELDGLHARSIEQAAAPQPAEPETDQQLLLKLLNNPEMAALLKTLAKSL